MDREMNRYYLWEEIGQFDSYNEYQRFYNWLQEQTLTNQAKEIPVEKYYAGENLQEYWFENRDGDIWRLVAPDFPFKGYWGKV